MMMGGWPIPEAGASDLKLTIALLASLFEAPREPPVCSRCGACEVHAKGRCGSCYRMWRRAGCRETMPPRRWRAKGEKVREFGELLRAGTPFGQARRKAGLRSEVARAEEENLRKARLLPEKRKPPCLECGAPKTRACQIEANEEVRS